MDSSSRSKRRWLYIGGALALLAGGRLFGSGNGARPGPPTAASEDAEAGSPNEATVRQPSPPLRHPPSALVELGVLTDKSESELEKVVDRATVAGLVRPVHCGDEEACAAVRAALQDAHTTTLQVVPASNWNITDSDLDASAATLSEALRASIKKRTHIVVVHVATATSSRQLAVRAAMAAAATISETLGGLVVDQLLGRIESPGDFAVHTVTAPLAGSTFRKDRIEVLYEPKGPGVVRILSAGLSRWGAPDVEAAAVPTASSGRIADLVLGLAEALANGTAAGPVTLSLDDLARLRGAPYPADPELPATTPVAIDLVSVHPEGGDPNDFIARIDPPGGTGPVGYLELAERFFGPLSAAPDEAALRASHERTQRALPAALARWSAARSRSMEATLLLQVPFDIEGEGGIESMWIDLTRYDARTVTGRLTDDPLGATRFNRGDEITKPRGDVEDLEMREGRDP